MYKSLIKVCLLVHILSLSIGFSVATAQDCPIFSNCSRSFFRPRPLSQMSVLEYGQGFYDIYHSFLTDGAPWFTFQFTNFYFLSRNKSQIAQFFLPNCLESVTIEQNNTSDVSSGWLEILRDQQDPFQGFMRIQPERAVIGGAFRLYFDLSCWLRNWWASIFIPLAQVRHSTNLCQDQATLDGVVNDAQDPIIAFNNPSWQFAKIPPRTLTKTGIDDLLVKVGWDFIKDEFAYNHIGAYGALFIPTTDNRSQAEFMFEPVLGAGNHWGLGVGLNADWWFWDYFVRSVCFMFDARYTYFLKGFETRTFDLKNGPWTRYLQLADTQNPISRSPGVNSLTKCVQVLPGSTVDVWAAFHYAWENLNFELGYNFWWRQSESITKPQTFFENKAIFDIVGAACGKPTSASTATIGRGVPGPGQPLSDPEVVPLTICDVDFDSAAHPRAYSNTIYAGISYDWFIQKYPTTWGFGVSYEFAHRTSALSQLGAWLKMGVRL